jgi:Integrase core domain
VLLREIRPVLPPPFELRFETPPGQQAQVDFAQFQTEFTDEPGVIRIVWLFSLVLGLSRMMWGRFVLHQDLPTVLRCHIVAFEALGGVPQQILYDRMKTAVIGKPVLGPAGMFQAVLRMERLITRDGMVSVNGNLYSVPNATRRRPVEVHSTAREIRIFEQDRLVAVHPVLEGRGQRRIAAGHRSLPPPADSHTPRQAPPPRRPGRDRGPAFLGVLRRCRSPPRGRGSRAVTGEFPPDAPIERIRRHLVGLRMPRALETLDHLVQQIERGQLGTIEAIEMLLAENSPSVRPAASRRHSIWPG